MSEPTQEAAYISFAAAAWKRHYGLATLLTGDAHRAEELLQDCLVKLYVRWRRVADGDPDAYLKRMLVNGNVSWWRRRRREVLTEAPERLDVRSNSPREPDDELRRALLALPRQQRAVVVLRHYADMTEAAAAELLGCSVGTVKSQHSRAMKRLRSTLALPQTEEITR
ncbi:SigE family RNA polymerase sigma factor [Actinomadura luteofluorescens]|uniref:RNA polymerase sigma-70 factor (Sigma-E family) n=1 Tax=Actinomadura luteofluorescens TaxID=46163 RepID=A0A7Y9EIU9_9ACTN|nr:SigE family RNA polymerase sigma factor [Actinomadura luteofluorescens]NYD48346.1 RNA polymerase sigma-70 factor (sigma-E family) [Actinomadura luteofluorescens]